MWRFFHGLRGKLILTYTLVTVLALLALEVLALLGFGIVATLSVGLDPNNHGYLSDVVSTLVPQARPYLQPGAEDLAGLQAWSERLYASGQASLPPQYAGDSPAAALVPGQPVYVLSPQSVVLAQAPAGPGSFVGQPFAAPSAASAAAVQHALTGAANVYATDLFAADGQGNTFIAVPVPQSVGSQMLVGVVVVSVRPAGAPWAWLLPVVGRVVPAAAGGVLLTALLLLIGVAPLGALFGLVMSRGLTRRLATLSAAADDWSEGNFTPLPPEKGADEISVLGQRLRRMAERLQTLLQTQQELAALEERNRLARDLHDTVKQQSFATLMQVRAARNLLAADPAAAEQHLAEAEGLIKTSQQELGRLITELRPAELEGQGLPAALRDLVGTWAQHAHLPTNCQVHGLYAAGERGLPLEVEQAFYRVAQEALANVARHSRASAVTVRLAYTPGEVSLVVSDNGVGFDPAAPTPGFGLQSMQQRLAALGGQLTVISAPESGATLTATIPVSG